MRLNQRNVLLLQLPIPPPGPQPIRGNVPLAAGYLLLSAQQAGLTGEFQIDILPSVLANTLSDRGLVAEIVARAPRLLGFTCYLWNIERTLWIAQEVKARLPDVQVLVGGPEITSDNGWVLENPAVDFASIGEGEQTFVELLQAIRDAEKPRSPINGLFVRGQTLGIPLFRKPLPHLNDISSPYLAGILDVADEQMMLLETIRGCIFKCKFCYYPKSYDDLYFLSQEKLILNLEHARERGAREIVILDPTLNQRKKFDDFLRLLGTYNPDGQFSYFGELRAEGINAETAKLLHAANFQEVEIGLQSVNGQAQALMDRKNNMKAFERGVSAMLDAGIQVKVDLIVGLPGDTPQSVREGMDYLLKSGMYSSVQVFNLSILPGTAFRQEATQLGLHFQDRPPYYVWKTPDFEVADLYGLMAEAQERFGIEFDPVPPPQLEYATAGRVIGGCRVELNGHDPLPELPPAEQRSQAFTLWLQATDWKHHIGTAVRLVEHLLTENPFTTLQVVLQPVGVAQSLQLTHLEAITRAFYARPTYLDKFYAVSPGPGRPLGAKRIVVILPADQRSALDLDWVSQLGDYATVVWEGLLLAEDDLEEHEYRASDLAPAQTVES